MAYTLTIKIDNQGLKQIAKAGEFVTIVQFVTQYAQSTASLRAESIATANPQTAVAWLSFSPFNNNTVVSTNSYTVFATDGLPSFGMPIAMSSTSEVAQLGWTYTLQNGFFTQANSNRTGYIVKNLENSPSGGMHFGLAAQAIINNRSQEWRPMNALFVPYNQSGWFLPEEKISIFVSTCSTSGAVIPGVGDGTVIDLSSNGTATVEFDDTTSGFMPMQ